MSPTFRSLRNRNYRLFWGGMAVSNVGTWMQRVAQDWLVLELSGGSGTALGITTGLQFLPLMLFSPYGGALADRLPKKRLLAITQSAGAGLAIALGVLAISGAVQVWHVYLLAFLLGISTAVDNPTRHSFVSELVEPEDLANAVGLNSASFNAARVIGPALAGLLIVLVGTGPVFLINSLTFIGPLVALFLLRDGVQLRTARRKRQKGMVRDGLRYVRGRLDLVLVLAIMFFVGTFGFNFQMTTALMATEVFHKGAGEYGVLGSVMAIGSLSGSLMAARQIRPRRQTVVVAGVVFSVLTIVAGLMPSYLTFMVMLIPVGMAALMVSTTANAYVQTSVAPGMRGRVMSLYIMVFMGGTPLGAPLIGWIGETFGARWTLIAGGAATLVGTVAVTLLLLRRGGHVLRPRIFPHPRVRVVPAKSRARLREITVA